MNKWFSVHDTSLCLPKGIVVTLSADTGSSLQTVRFFHRKRSAKNVSGTAVFLWTNVWVLDKYSLDSILRIPSDWLDWIKMQKDHPLKAASCLQIDIICIHLVRKHVCRTGQVPILSFSDLSGYLFSLTTLFLPRPSLLWLWAYPPHNGLRQNPRQRTPDPVTTIPWSAA